MFWTSKRALAPGIGLLLVPVSLSTTSELRHRRRGHRGCPYIIQIAAKTREKKKLRSKLLRLPKGVYHADVCNYCHAPNISRVFIGAYRVRNRVARTIPKRIARVRLTYVGLYFLFFFFFFISFWLLRFLISGRSDVYFRSVYCERTVLNDDPERIPKRVKIVELFPYGRTYTQDRSSPFTLEPLQRIRCDRVYVGHGYTARTDLINWTHSMYAICTHAVFFFPL